MKGVWFQLDNVRVHYDSIEVPSPACSPPLRQTLLSLTMSLSVSVHQGKSFTYYQNPQFFPLNRDAPDAPYRFKPGGVIAVEVR